ncbi:MAG: hypothetical protein U9O54_07580 [Chloroflexota bacterium]|nr:hypothetical protein [Chloroflexota bacterium]
MPKRIKFAVFFLLTIMLTACAGASKVEVVTEPQTAPTAAPPAVAHPPTATMEEEVAPVTAPICVAQEPKPTPPAEVVEIFTPNLEEDWIKGPEDAAVTIVEYGDFQ